MVQTSPNWPIRATKCWPPTRGNGWTLHPPDQGVRPGLPGRGRGNREHRGAADGEGLNGLMDEKASEFGLSNSKRTFFPFIFAPVQWCSMMSCHMSTMSTMSTMYVSYLNLGILAVSKQFPNRSWRTPQPGWWIPLMAPRTSSIARRSAFFFGSENWRETNGDLTDAERMGIWWLLLWYIIGISRILNNNNNNHSS